MGWWGWGGVGGWGGGGEIARTHFIQLALLKIHVSQLWGWSKRNTRLITCNGNKSAELKKLQANKLVLVLSYKKTKHSFSCIFLVLTLSSIKIWLARLGTRLAVTHCKLTHGLMHLCIYILPGVV